jgi:SAM-dependent methyltransferase
MNLVESDRAFGDAISDHYERLLVPLIFEPYAAALAERLALRLAGRPRARVLEVAAGTGALTRAMSSRLPAGAEIVATDLNEAMLDRARSVGTSRRVEWRRADALALPFPDASFDVVVCQFGSLRPCASPLSGCVVTSGIALLMETSRTRSSMRTQRIERILRIAPCGQKGTLHRCWGFVLLLAESASRRRERPSAQSAGYVFPAVPERYSPGRAISMCSSGRWSGVKPKRA